MCTAAIDLVKDLAKALSETSGSKVEYQDLMSQLYTLEKALAVVKTLDPSIAEYHALLQAVGGCQQCISAFLKVGKFASSSIIYIPLSGVWILFGCNFESVQLSHDLIGNADLLASTEG